MSLGNIFSVFVYSAAVEAAIATHFTHKSALSANFHRWWCWWAVLRGGKIVFFPLRALFSFARHFQTEKSIRPSDDGFSQVFSRKTGKLLLIRNWSLRGVWRLFILAAHFVNSEIFAVSFSLKVNKLSLVGCGSVWVGREAVNWLCKESKLNVSLKMDENWWRKSWRKVILYPKKILDFKNSLKTAIKSALKYWKPMFL